MSNMSLETIYENIPAEQRQRLTDFRASHPYRQLNVNGVSWEYITSGSGPETVLLLGGGLSTGESSFSRILELETRCRVIAPSYPAGSTLDEILTGLVAILDAEGVSTAHVYGHSLGAGIAHVLVRRSPQRVDKLVLSSFGLYMPARYFAIRLVLGLFKRLPFSFTQRHYMRRFKKMLSTSEDPEARFMLAYAAELLLIQHTKQSVMGQLGLLGELFGRAEAYRTRQPIERAGRVLIISAADDRGFKPAEQQALWETYPGAHVHQFESGGHLAGYTRRTEFNQIVDDFLFGDSAPIEPAAEQRIAAYA